MARKVVKIKDSKMYFDNCFKCENLVWKKEDARTSIVWCKIAYIFVSFTFASKLNKIAKQNRKSKWLS